MRLARAVIAERDDAEAALLLAEALFEQGAYDDAEHIIAGYAERPDIDDALRLLLTEMQVAEPRVRPAPIRRRPPGARAGA